jgi:hypothetical protein
MFMMKTSLRQAYRNLFPDMSASILVVTKLISSLSIYIFFVYNIFFSLLVLLTAHRKLLSK